MQYQFNTITSLQLEITTHCNAACPQCPRNNYGGSTVEDLPLITWSLNDLQKILPTDFVNQLKFLYFCGTYGDPMFNKSIVDMCAWLKHVNPLLKIGIHTNGSLGGVKSYQQLAKLVSFISFGIDGLEDTNSIYRRNTVWSNIIKNSTEFINSGGQAHWDYIVFEHNQHQVEQARLLSTQLKFNTFNIKKTYRFFNKSHNIVPSVKVLDTDGNVEYEIKPPTQPQYQNKNMILIKFVDKKSYVNTATISCAHLAKNEIYIGADGYVFPCGWLHDRLYGIESNKTSDRILIWELMNQIGGRHMANCFHTSLESIVNGKWFQTIQDSWKSPNQLLERCAWLCGDRINFIKEQNELLNYEL